VIYILKTKTNIGNLDDKRIELLQNLRIIKFSKTLLLWTLILCACFPGITAPETFPASDPTNTHLPPPDTITTFEFPPNITTNVPTGPKIIVTVGTPNIGQGPDGNFQNTQLPTEQCAFSWAQQLLEELTVVFEASIKKLNPEASARAIAFGEDCNYPDGRKVFLAMETDFYIEQSVTNLINFESFGNWIAQTMPVVASMPPNLIEGPHVGFVEYRFIKNDGEQLIVRVPIQEYNNSAQGKTGEVLFQLFYTK